MSAVVVAAGRSERFGGDTPKLLVPWRGRPLLGWTMAALEAADVVSEVVLVASDRVAEASSVATWRGPKLTRIVAGGATRQESVEAGVAAISPAAEVVLVHDGARPFVTPALVERVARAAERSGAALPVLSVVDTVKEVAESADGRRFVSATVDRTRLACAQTPQGFRVDVLREAQGHARRMGLVATDDAALVEAACRDGVLGAGVRVEVVAGEEANVKVTRQADLPSAPGETRVGLGHDVHPLEVGRAFHLAGVDLQAGVRPDERFGPVGHSDGDVLSHAVCDALLGAAALGDIGRHFPDTDARNAGRSSLEFVGEVVAILARAGWQPRNLSSVLHLERPRVAPHADRIRQALARALGLPPERVGLSAKRGEGMGPVGEGRAVACDVVALVESLP